jgi:hypothetical protein
MIFRCNCLVHQQWSQRRSCSSQTALPVICAAPRCCHQTSYSHLDLLPFLPGAPDGHLISPVYSGNWLSWDSGLTTSRYVRRPTETKIHFADIGQTAWGSCILNFPSRSREVILFLPIILFNKQPWLSGRGIGFADSIATGYPTVCLGHSQGNGYAVSKHL